MPNVRHDSDPVSPGGHLMARPVVEQLVDLQLVVIKLRKAVCRLNGVVSRLVEGGPLEQPTWLDECQAVAEDLLETRQQL